MTAVDGVEIGRGGVQIAARGRRGYGGNRSGGSNGKATPDKPDPQYETHPGVIARRLYCYSRSFVFGILACAALAAARGRSAHGATRRSRRFHGQTIGTRHFQAGGHRPHVYQPRRHRKIPGLSRRPARDGARRTVVHFYQRSWRMARPPSRLPRVIPRVRGTASG